MHDTLEKNNNTFFKLTFPNAGNELKVVMWALGISEQFLLHVCTVIHACKQMGLDVNFADAKKAFKTKNLDMDFAKMEYTQLCCPKKKKSKGKKEKSAHQNLDPESVPSALAVTRQHMKKQ